MSLPMPKRVPEPGFYYHYKHDHTNPDINNFAYEFIGVGFHTEGDCRPGEEHFVIYRPLYSASVYKASRELSVPCFDSRPLEMWMGTVTVDGITQPRFRKITDLHLIRRFEMIRNEMYGVDL